jgi:hypothetical protein
MKTAKLPKGIVHIQSTLTTQCNYYKFERRSYPGRQQVVVGLKALVNQRRLLLRQPLKQRRVNQWIKD